MLYFIGFDHRQTAAAKVLAYNLRMLGRENRVYPLNHRALRRRGLFTRPWKIDARGQFWCDVDGRPFSTEFSHSRFLSFHLARLMGECQTCAFVDCDFAFRENPTPYLRAAVSKDRPLACVKAARRFRTEVKMDGMMQEAYQRKLWSSLFAFRPSHPEFDRYTPEVVNTADGRALHTFLGMHTDQIAALPPDLNYVPGLDAPVESARGVHYSERNPWMHSECTEFPDDWSLWHRLCADAGVRVDEWGVDAPDIPVTMR